MWNLKIYRGQGILVVNSTYWSYKQVCKAADSAHKNLGKFRVKYKYVISKIRDSNVG